jgi:hypothetical protein
MINIFLDCSPTKFVYNCKYSLITQILFFLLDQKEAKNQVCTEKAKILTATRKE